MGAIVGYAVSLYLRYRASGKTHPVLERALSATSAELLLVVIVACYIMYALCTPQYIQQASGILVVFVITLTLSELAPTATVAALKDALTGLWTFVEIFLFTSTGVNLSLRAINGPEQSQRGLTTSDAV